VSQRSRRLRLVHIYLDADAVDVRGLATSGVGPARAFRRRGELPAGAEPERRRPEP